MLTFTVALPLNHPDSQLPAMGRDAAVQELADALLEITSDPFGAGAIHMRMRFAAGADFPATAMWSGELAPVGEDNLVVIELAPALTLHLLTLIPSGYPVPRKVIAGPLRLDNAISDWFLSAVDSLTVTAGQIIGRPASDTLELGFLDADDFAIDPSWCLRLFDALRVWDLPDPGSNPFQAPGALPATALVVPRNAPASGAGITFQASGSNAKLIRPPSNLSGALTSFIASDTITIGLQGVTPIVPWSLRIEDLTFGPYRSATSPFSSPFGAVTEATFNPQLNLTPAPFQTASPQRTPLHYRVTIEFENGQPAPPALDIEQDPIDVLRQEYETGGLPVPGRERFGFVPGGWETFDVDSLYQNDAFFGGRLGLDPIALPRLVEAIGHAFDRHLHPAGLANNDVAWYLSSQLLVVDGYRSPQKNRLLGGSNDHPAQHGFYLKLRPLADTKPGIIFQALVAAALEILEALQDQNATRTFSQLELRLTSRLNDWVWTWRLGATGVQSVPGPAFPGSDPATEANALVAGRDLELFFLPNDRADAIQVPVPQRRETTVAAGRISILLYSSDVPNAGERIPVDDAAYTVRNWLTQAYPQDSTPDILQVENPLQVFERLRLFSGEQRHIRFVFLFAHSNERGLALLNSTDVTPAQNHWASRFDHSSQVKERLKDIYGSHIEFGGDEREDFSTRHLYISNLTKLPRDLRRRLRASFKQAEGVFLLGCNSDLNASSVLTISEIFATSAGVPVWGAGDTSRFYRRDSFSIWSKHVEVQGQGDPNAAEVVLLPKRFGSEMLGQPIRLDLMLLYRMALTREMPVDVKE